MRYLVDTSALVRILRQQADPRWTESVVAGHVALCEPVLTETLTIANARLHDRVETELREAYPWVPVVDDVWSMVAAVRRDLAAQSQHQGLSVADYLVLVTAIKLKLVVLHEDADFETAARVIPQLHEQRLSGSTP